MAYNHHQVAERKILPFDCTAGRVPGHAIKVYSYEAKPNFPKSVVFWTFDSESQCNTEIVVSVHDFTKFVKRSSRSHTVQAVIMDDGTRIHATGISILWGSDGQYERAPLLARGLYGVRMLCAGYNMLEVAGVSEYFHSGGIWGDRERDESLIIDPWARDNAEFQARMSALQQQGA